MKDVKEGKSMGIAFKTAITCGIIISLMLAANTALFNYLEHRLVQTIFDQYSLEVQAVIDNQGQRQKENLRSTLKINIEMLAGATATMLYNFDTVSIERMMTGFITLPDIVAVQVFDDADKPFFAIWKDPAVKNGDQLPSGLAVSKALSYSADSFVKEERVGSVTIFFTDEKVLAEVTANSEGSRRKIADFMKTVDDDMSQVTLMQAGVAVAFVVVLIIMIMFVLNIVALRPLKTLTEMVVDLVQGEGDLTKRLELKSRDEIGVLASWFNEFITNMQKLITELSGKAATLQTASEQMSGIAACVSSGADRMSERSAMVAGAAGQLSGEMNGVTMISEQAATNVSVVAIATDEMTATVDEIAGNSERARTVTESAVERARNASVQVNELGSAAHEITKVTEVITEISEQTNLLALNATIEAARAGEAGRGFAVVANEIKELAKQTANATLDIKTRVESIQHSTGTTVGEIEEITRVIDDVNNLVSTIAGAVEEQAITTREIAGNVAQASEGIGEVNSRISQNSAIASEISDSIAEVDSYASDMNSSSSQVSEGAAGLLQLAGEISEMVGRFKI